MPTATFAAGYGNLYGDYWKETTKGWAERIPGQADLIEAVCSPDEDTSDHATEGLFFVALELHAEHNAHFPLMDKLGSRWGIDTGPGGNLLLHKEELEVLSGTDVLAPGNRWMTRWNVRHAETGVKWWIVGFHATAGGGPKYDAIRTAQAHFVCSQTATLHRAIMCADWNSASYSPGKPHDVLDEAGWRSIRKASARPVVNNELSSHSKAEAAAPGQAGLWIEGIYVKDLVTVEAAAAVPTNSLSDHTAWFRGTFSISDDPGSSL
jgi:hypothetical protein